jgi:hypothetical protein
VPVRVPVPGLASSGQARPGAKGQGITPGAASCYNPRMAGMDSKYLKDLEQVLEAEAKLKREGVDLLADAEYRALRERFIDGEMPIEEFVGRVEGLAEIRADDDEADATDEDGDDEDPDLEEDLSDLDDIEDLQVLRDLRDLDGVDDSGPVSDDPDR